MSAFDPKRTFCKFYGYIKINFVPWIQRRIQKVTPRMIVLVSVRFAWDRSENLGSSTNEHLLCLKLADEVPEKLHLTDPSIALKL